MVETEARRKELEWKKRQNREEPMLMKEKKKILSLLPHHYNSESPLTSRYSSLQKNRNRWCIHSRCSSLQNHIRISSQSYWFSFKTATSPFEGSWWPERGFFGLRQPSTPQNSPTQRRSMGSATITIVNNRHPSLTTRTSNVAL